MQQIGGALGLAILVTAFGSVIRGAGKGTFTEGVGVAFTVGAVLTACAVLLALIMRDRRG